MNGVDSPHSEGNARTASTSSPGGHGARYFEDDRLERRESAGERGSRVRSKARGRTRRVPGHPAVVARGRHQLRTRRPTPRGRLQFSRGDHGSLPVDDHHIDASYRRRGGRTPIADRRARRRRIARARFIGADRASANVRVTCGAQPVLAADNASIGHRQGLTGVSGIHDPGTGLVATLTADVRMTILIRHEGLVAQAAMAGR